MDTSNVLLDIALVLIIARVLGELAVHIRMPSVIGELCAGILLGPTLLGIVEPEGMIQILAEIGIILLLFQIGLETDLGDLVESGGKSVVVALLGFIFPFLLCFSLSYYWFDLSVLASMLVGGTMTATSIGITMRCLADLGRAKSKEGQIVLGAAVLDDILGVLLLALLFDFATNGDIDLASASRVLLFMVVFFMLAPTLAKSISYVIRRSESISLIAGMVPTSIVSLVLFLAWLSHAIGVPELLGGFATGLALSRRFFIPFGVALRADPDFSNHIQDQMKPIIHLFTPMFFVYVGLTLDLSSIHWGSKFFWLFSISLTVLAVLSKIGGAMFIREKLSRKIAIGMAMVPRGEVGLIFAEIGRSSGAFNNEIYATMIMVIAYTTLFAPFWLRLYYQRYGSYLDNA